MKEIKAYIHHVRSAAVVEALCEAKYKNITLVDVKGTLKSLNEFEQDYSSDAGVIISEVQISLVCEDRQVNEVIAIIQQSAEIGPDISGWVMVYPLEQLVPIGKG